MIYTYIYLTAWLMCNTILFALAIRRDAPGGVYVAILLFTALTGIIRMQVTTRGAEDA